MQKKFLSSLLALLPVLGAAAEPGEYYVWTGDEPDTVCLLADGTWYDSDPTFWTGTWADAEGVTYLTGNGAGGAVSTVISFRHLSNSSRLGMRSTVVVWATNDPPLLFPHAWVDYVGAHCELPAAQGARHGVLGRVWP